MLQNIPPGETLSKLHERMIPVTRGYARSSGAPIPVIYYQDVFEVFVTLEFTVVSNTTPFYFQIKRSEVQITKSHIQIKRDHIQIKKGHIQI